MQFAYLSPAFSGMVSFLVLRWLLSSRPEGLPLDHPNERSLHDTPVPRSGGIGIMAGIFVAGMLLASQWPLLLACAGLLALLSFLDDLRGLSAAVRLAAHLMVALAFTLGAFPDLPLLWIAVLVVATVWTINLYNFMDGSDGLAGGMALVGFVTYGVAAWTAGLPSLALLSWSVAASALAFLLFNFPPARIFMGDVGSVPLGFLAAALGIEGWHANAWPLWFPVLVFSPFIVDATLTLAKRLLRGERVWEAHREHYYQKLVRMGKGHRQTALAEYVIMAACALSALWGMRQTAVVQTLLLLCWAVIYALIMMHVDRQWRKCSKQG
jgi:UDP-N-acetylmuramyl pentapeptide phosphotransferase/UDP-N-acetylglucosamine-1-phosphate transferase